MNETKIEWTDLTWNPVSGCEVVSEGCKFCYAKTLAENKRGTPAFRNGFDITIRRHKLTEPFRVKAPSRIFVNSMSDLFWEQIPDDYRSEIIDVIWQTPQHSYQVLTKRPDRMAVWFADRDVPPNFWAGTTIESGRVRSRIDHLLSVNAKIRFVSAEPLLDGIDGMPFDGIHWCITGGESGVHLSDPRVCERRGLVAKGEDGDWFVREERADWVRSIRDRCIASRTAFLHKQWGGLRPKSCGRLLDGRVWDEYPDQSKPPWFGDNGMTTSP